MSKTLQGLNRDQLAKALGGNYAVIRAFEQLVLDNSLTPTTIEEANATANTALAAAGQALDMLVSVLSAVEPLENAPVQIQEPQEEQFIPAVPVPVLGTIAEQDASAVAITGGTVALTKFGTSGKPPQDAYTLGDAATDLASVITLVNNIRIALLANGIGK